MADPSPDPLANTSADIVHVGQFDFSSVFRERRLRRRQFEEWARAPSFCNVLPFWDVAEDLSGGGPFMSEALAIDAASTRRYPFEANSVAVIADFDGPSRDIMPRATLRTQIERAARLGFEIRAAFEFEVIFLAESAESLRASGFTAPTQFAPSNKCWSGQTAAQHSGFVTELEEVLALGDIDVFALAGELGPGCFEATLGAVDALRAADDASFFRLFTRAFARQRGMTASFMPYLGPDYPGIGGHVSISLNDTSGTNLFADAQAQTSKLARSCIAGMTEIVPHGFAMCAQTVNAYRRFAPGSWAPKSVGWQELTYTTAVRSVPSAADDARLEFRLPGADCNPYLTLALVIGAALDGIERDLPCPPAAIAAGPDDVPPGTQRLPRDLGHAVERLRASEDVKRIFGPAFVEHFAAVCESEDASLRRAVSTTEIKRYLEE